MKKSEEEKRPYNPYHLASGHAGASIGDKKAVAVFKCLCSHSDYLGGSVSVSIPTIMRETQWSEGSVNAALRLLISMGRIKRKSRGRPGIEGGKQSSITTVYCTDAELAQAGANEENFYSRGGKGFVVKTQSDIQAERAESEHRRTLNIGSTRVKTQKKMSENANSPESKRKTGVVKTQPVASKPSSSEPFRSEPLQQPVQAAPASLCSPNFIEPKSTPRTQENTTPAGIRNHAKGSARDQSWLDVVEA